MKNSYIDELKDFNDDEMYLWLAMESPDGPKEEFEMLYATKLPAIRIALAVVSIVENY